MNEFNQMVDRLVRTRASLPNQIAVVAVAFTKERFQQQNWMDQIAQAWSPRKSRREGGTRRSQTLLVNTGRLKRSIRKISANQNLIVVGTDSKYGQIHNDGGTINKTVNIGSFTKRGYTRVRNDRRENVRSHTVNAHSRRMNTTIPKRQFIGNSAELNRRVENLIIQKLEAALRG